MTEQVFLMLKPDAIKRKLVGKILSKIEEETDLVLEKIAFIKPTKGKIEAWYNQKDKFSKKIYPPKEIIVKYLCSGYVMPTVWSGENALEKIRKIVGNDTNPTDSETGSIRRDFGIDNMEMASKENRAVENLVHASRKKENIKREIEFWFGK